MDRDSILREPNTPLVATMSVRKRMSVRKGLSSLSVVCITASVLTITGTPESAEAAPSLPSGFQLSDVGTGQGEFNLTDFAYLPDESVLTTGKNGRVTWLRPGNGTPVQIASLPTMSSGDSGLVSIAVPADFATSRQVYTSGSVPSGSTFNWRVSRWTVTGDDVPTGLTNEQTILQIPGTTDVHGMSNIEFGSDGTLWVAMGDSSHFAYADTRALRTQDLDQPYGKMFHLNPNGSGVAGNPFYQTANPNSVRSKVYANGLRSPFRFTLDPASGTPIVGDVGWNTTEEINIVRAGQNYKWPCWEGNNPTPGYNSMAGCAGVANNPPLWQYPRSVGGSVTGGIHYRGTSYPESYRGAYFFGDYVSDKLWTMTSDSSGKITRPPESNAFARDIGGPVSFASAPNGDIVYADIFTGQLRRLSYAPGNTAPVAKIATTTDPATRTASFDASESYDLDGDQLTYRWDFGDGATATGATATHTYAAAPEQFTATLTVTDHLGATGTATATVVPANEVPELTLTGTDPDGLFAVGDPVSLTASAADAEDGPLEVSWTSREVHCPTEATCHSHPGPEGTGGTYDIPFTGHPDSHMEITATATDSRGVQSSETYFAQPRRHRITLTANTPAHMTISPSGSASALVTVGSPVTIEAAVNALDGVATFDRWSSGAARSHTMTMPDADVAMSAAYLTPIDKRYAAEPALRTLVGPATGPELSDGSIRFRDYTSARLYWTSGTGVHEIHHANLSKYKALGGHAKFGVPTTDETRTPDGIGRYNHFTGTPATMAASVYYSPNTGSHAVWGVIRQRWQSMNWELGPMGYPTTSELTPPDGYGRFNHFSGKGMPASIYWSGGTGAQPVWGAIRERWAATGWELGPMGYPTTSELTPPDGYGRFNHFTGRDGMPASIYWTNGTGAQHIHGMIRARWSALGWERSYLGYPTTGEFGVPGGRQNNFIHGYVFWNAGNGAVTDRRW